MQDIDLNKATQPYEYYMKHIKENRRPDGRKLSDIRPCSVRVDCIQNTTNGSSTVTKFPQISSTLIYLQSFLNYIFSLTR